MMMYFYPNTFVNPITQAAPEASRSSTPHFLGDLRGRLQSLSKLFSYDISMDGLLVVKTYSSISSQSSEATLLQIWIIFCSDGQEEDGRSGVAGTNCSQAFTCNSKPAQA